mgnify:CR=1 FL=1
MKKILLGGLHLMGYALLLTLPGVLVIVISVVAPIKIWSRMENETSAQYAQRMQLQAMAFRTRAR